MKHTVTGWVIYIAVQSIAVAGMIVGLAMMFQ